MSQPVNDGPHSPSFERPLGPAQLLLAEAHEVARHNQVHNALGGPGDAPVALPSLDGTLVLSAEDCDAQRGRRGLGGGS